MTDASATTNPAAVPDPGTAPAAVPASDRGDFDARIRSDPTFALEQVKNAQREVARLQGKFSKDIEQLIDAAGGPEALPGHLQRLNNLLSNPAMRAVVMGYESTGVVPSQPSKPNGKGTAPAPDDDDDSFEEPWTQELRTLREENASLRADVNVVRGERGVEKVRGFFTSFFEEFPLAEEDRKTLVTALEDQAKKWAGDPQGLNVLKVMDMPTFRSFALGKLTKDQIQRAMLADQQAAASRRMAAATDVPSRVRTQAREEPAGLSPSDAFIQACREEGIDPRAPLPV
jgi:hypothetical protein